MKTLLQQVEVMLPCWWSLVQRRSHMEIDSIDQGAVLREIDWRRTIWHLHSRPEQLCILQFIWSYLERCENLPRFNYAIILSNGGVVPETCEIKSLHWVLVRYKCKIEATAIVLVPQSEAYDVISLWKQHILSLMDLNSRNLDKSVTVRFPDDDRVKDGQERGCSAWQHV